MMQSGFEDFPYDPSLVVTIWTREDFLDIGLTQPKMIWQVEISSMFHQTYYSTSSNIPWLRRVMCRFIFGFKFKRL